MREGNIIGLYLAAGQSKRMGRHKLSLPLGTDCLGSVALKTILQSNIHFTIVVTNPSDKLTWISPSLKDDPRWCSITCSDAWKGQAYSLRSGIRHALLFRADAIIICLADQPFITKNMINQLIEEYDSNRDLEIVASSFEKITRPPILFSKKLFSELLLIEGDRGAKELLKSRKQLERLEFHDSYSFLDVDDEIDYKKICHLIDKQIGREES